MANTQPSRRDLESERLAIQRCTTEEARQALKAYFDRTYPIYRAASIKGNASWRPKVKHEATEAG